MRFSKLRGKIKEVFHSERVFARAMDLTHVTMSHKLNGKSGWTLEEIKKACELLFISKERVGDYFFENGDNKC